MAEEETNTGEDTENKESPTKFIGDEPD